MKKPLCGSFLVGLPWNLKREVVGVGSTHEKALNALPAKNTEMSKLKKYADYQIGIWTKILQIIMN